MKQYTDSDKLFRSDMLRRYPGKHTKIYRDYAYEHGTITMIGTGKKHKDLPGICV